MGVMISIKDHLRVVELPGRSATILSMVDHLKDEHTLVDWALMQINWYIQMQHSVINYAVKSGRFEPTLKYMRDNLTTAIEVRDRLESGL